MIQLTISLVTANNKKLITECLESIYAHREGLDLEIFVVINDSQDESEAALRARFPEVHLIINEKRCGFTHNHNLVMRRAAGKYILILNDDTLIQPGALLKMINFMESSPSTGILGCRILNPDGSLQWSTGRSISPKFEYFRSAVLRSLVPFLIKDHHFEETLEVSWVTGACLLARSAALQQIGLFDENIIIYYEDGDLCYRMIQAGWKVVFYPHAEIIHYLGQTRRHHLARDIVIIYQSGCYFFNKHYSRPTAVLIRLLLLLVAIFRYSINLVPLSSPQRHIMRQAYGEVIRLFLGVASARKAADD